MQILLPEQKETGSCWFSHREFPSEQTQPVKSDILIWPAWLFNQNSPTELIIAKSTARTHELATPKEEFLKAYSKK